MDPSKIVVLLDERNDLKSKLAAAEARVKYLESRDDPETMAYEANVRLLQSENAKLREALQKIAEPMKYHHWEEDAYTRAACFQFVADEALKQTR